MKTQINGKIFHGHGLKELILLKCPFNVISIKIPMAFFIEIEQTILKFVWTTKDPQEPKQSWERRKKARGITCPDFKLYCRATVIKAIWYWHKDRHIDQWKKGEPRNKPTCMWSTKVWQKSQGNTMRKGQSL